MTSEFNWLVHDHKKYDQALDDCELAAGAGDWKTAVSLFHGFIDDLKLHMQMEDEVLYPYVEEVSGDPDGDLTLLKDEHDDLARLLGDLLYVIKTKNFDHFEESLAPMHRLMNEHNENEEAFFKNYVKDNVLLKREEIVARLDEIKPQTSRRKWTF